jgi:hypothetical protein
VPYPRTYYPGVPDESRATLITIAEGQELSPGEPEDGFAFDRGTSFFAKGRVKGEWLMTASYDSQRTASESDDQFRRALDGGIDPNRYYTLYGDASETRVETPSQRPLYLKLERKQFYALFGDYTTGLTTTELSRYTRNLNGLHSEYEGENFAYSAFGTDSSQAFVKDEIRGDGTSGLYQLTRRTIVVNSEKVRIEVRNRFHSEDIVSTTPQARYADYNIDYQNGTIFFKQPIPSHGDGFNPVFIVVEYEADDQGDKQISGGGRGAVKFLDDKVELGSTLLHEGTVGRTSSLYGGDMRIEQDRGKLSAGQLRLYHSMYQLFTFTMLLALLTNNVGILWVAMEAATLATVLLVSLYRTPAGIEAAWKYFILCGVGIAQALFGRDCLCR